MKIEFKLSVFVFQQKPSLKMSLFCSYLRYMLSALLAAYLTSKIIFMESI